MKISGKIFDKSDGSTLPGANINMVEPNGKISSFGVNSDENGDFQIDSQTILSNTNFKISYIGYKDQIYSASELQNKNIYLAENAIMLDNLVITRDNSNNLPSNNSINDKIISSIKKNQKPIILIAAITIIGISIMIIKKNV